MGLAYVGLIWVEVSYLMASVCTIDRLCQVGELQLAHHCHSLRFCHCSPLLSATIYLKLSRVHETTVNIFAYQNETTLLKAFQGAWNPANICIPKWNNLLKAFQGVWNHCKYFCIPKWNNLLKAFQGTVNIFAYQNETTYLNHSRVCDTTVNIFAYQNETIWRIHLPGL